MQEKQTNAVRERALRALLPASEFPKRNDNMIVRSWRGRATRDRALLYAQHLVDAVIPKLEDLDGFRGYSLLRRVDGQEVEVLVETYWESMEAIERFAGPTPHVAVVEPAARAVLTSFDATVLHYEVVAGAVHSAP